MSIWKYVRSSIGSKQIMGLAGLALCGFVIVHLAGNLLLFQGADTFNAYARLLTSSPLLIPAELGLVAIFLAHIAAGVKLVTGNWRAKPVKYQAPGLEEIRYWPSSWMIFTGLTVFAFIVVHLATLKYDARSKVDLYALVVDRFSSPWYSGFYVFCMLSIGVHLFHGFQSAFLTLGLDHPKYSSLIKGVGCLYAVAMAAGFAVIPVYVYLRQGGILS